MTIGEQGCQVAEISAKNLKRATEKYSWPEEFVAEFWSNFTKSSKKGAEEYFLKKLPTYLTVPYWHTFRDKEKL